MMQTESDICTLCPRGCGAARTLSGSGFCHQRDRAVVARAAPHFGEEPCISGTRGSGAVFFAGCSLRCVFCQNHVLRDGLAGVPVDTDGLRRILLGLQDDGVHNLNLVTASHFTPAVARALAGLPIRVPVVWNSSAYETIQSLRMLQGLVHIYMPDMKFAIPTLAARYACAPDYPARAARAILEMFRQVGPPVFDGDGILRSGVLIRHLVLPGQVENTRHVIDWAAQTFPPGSVLFSLMSQYTPCQELPGYPELCRPISREEYEDCLHYLQISPLRQFYIQELSSAGADAIPAFDLTGVRTGS